jgi:hypothetical protein
MDAQEFLLELDHCQTWLAAQLNREDVPDAVWGHVLKLGLPYEVITGGDDRSRRELVDEAKAYLRASHDESPGYGGRLSRGSERGAREEVELGLDAYTLKRGQAFSEVTAALANTRGDVRSFRERYLGGRLLSDEEAATFLEDLEANCRSFDTNARKTRDELYKLADLLARAYRWREGDGEGDARWFVLTGNVPEVRPVVVAVARHWSRRNPNWAQVILTIEPWVDAREVARLYKAVQKQVLGKAENKKTSDHVLDAVRFVAQQIREHGDESWSRRVERWNRAHPEQRYKDFRGLRQAFERFVHPTYHRPKWRSYRPSSYQAWREQRRRAENARRQQ